MPPILSALSALRQRWSTTASLRHFRSGDRIVVWGIFFLALILRLCHLVEIRDTPYFATLVLDAYEYEQMAARLLQGDWLLDYEGGYVHGLLYPYVLALLKWLGGSDHYLTSRIFQAVLGSLSCVLVYRIAGYYFPRSVSLLAGLLAAGYWPFVFYNGELLATTLVVFVELLLVLLLQRCAAGRSFPAVFGAGILLALLVMGRSNTLLLLPLSLVWIYLMSGGTKTRRGWLLLVFSLAFIAALTPFLLRNYLVQGHPFPFQGGWSFYMGNNPAADGTPYARQGLAWQRLELLPLWQGTADPAEKGAFYIREGARFIQEQPGTYLLLLYRKFRLFWHAFEIPVSADLRYYEERSLLGRLLVFDFGIAAPLALAGLAFCWSQRRKLFLLYGFILVYLASGLLFSVCARYRLPAMPFLLIFSSCGIWQLWQLLRDRNILRTGAFLLLLGTAFALVHAGVDTRQADHLRSSWLLGHVYLRQRNYDLAEQAYVNGLREFPDDADMHNSLGVVYEFQRRDREAETSYRKAVEIASDHARARVNLGKLYLKQRRLEEAGTAFEEALQQDPRPANQHEGLFNLGYVYLFQKAYLQAYRSFKRALEVQERTQAYYGLANACAHLGRVREQVRALEQAVQLDPKFAPAHRNLGVLYLQEGNFTAAEDALLQAVRHDPSSAVTYRHLGALYEKLGRIDQARAAFEKARQLSERR